MTDCSKLAASSIVLTDLREINTISKQFSAIFHAEEFSTSLSTDLNELMDTSLNVATLMTRMKPLVLAQGIYSLLCFFSKGMLHDRPATGERICLAVEDTIMHSGAVGEAVNLNFVKYFIIVLHL